APVAIREVLDAQPLQLAILTERHEVQHARREPVAAPRDPRVAEAVTALVLVELRAARFPAGRPDGVAVLDVEAASAVVERDVVVAVSRQPAEARVAPEAVAAAGVRDDRNEIP